MDAPTKRKLAERVRRGLTQELKQHGLHRAKTSFWAREAGCVIQFVCLHLFTYKPGFRVHPGIRLLNSQFDGVVMNGLDVTDVPGYDFNYSESDESVTRCARDIARYVRSEVLPWFEMYSDVPALQGADSPLDEVERILAGRPVDPESASRSRKLIGVV